MIKLDHDFLAECGYGSLTRAEGNRLLQVVYEAAEEITGLRLALEWSDAQLAEFDGLFAARKDKEAFEWLKRNNPEYEQVVRDTFDALTAALKLAAAPTASAKSPDDDSNR